MSLSKPLIASDNLKGVIAAIEGVSRPNLSLIDGQAVAAKSGKTFAHISPRDGSLICNLASCDFHDVDLAVRSARQAFEDGRWRKLPPKVKAKILRKLADLMTDHRENLALLETLDTGKPLRDARAVDIPLSIQSVRYYAEAIDKIYGEVSPTPDDRLSFSVHEPLGVIGAIVPWNFPLHMAMWKVAPALAMGNSVVLKPAELSSMSVLYTAQLALEAGLPAGVWNVVTGTGLEAGDALARHMDVDMIAFTGSGPVGRALMKASAESNLKRVSLELGGKSPQIIFADAENLQKAAEHAAWGVFYNQGQVCTAGSRLLVEASIKDAFVNEVISVAKAIKIGDPYDPDTQFGTLISKTQMNTVLGFIDKGQAEGAHLVMGGQQILKETGGIYVEPTLFDQVRPDNILAREEVFGPVISVMTFEDEAEALRLANETIYGLASGVWTGSLSRAMRFTRDLRAGLVWVNGWDACDITSPFGGFKQSGFGRDRSLHALYKYADLKAVSISFEG
jgi:4-(gamma-glutamylamino)butanal dehydrogenase